jgi:DNA (cytosine-5)-methyltransferase 1
MYGLDLFSGIGGLSYALQDYVYPVAFCEIDPYCQSVLLSRMADGSLRDRPIWDDIRTLQGKPFERHVDIIYGGFPCQDISVAGDGQGLEGDRSGLFFEILRLAKEIKPRIIFLENVPAISSRGGLQVVREIAEMGYDCRWCVISAASVGAIHRRERWFLLAKAKSCDGRRYKATKIPGQKEQSRSGSFSKSISNSQSVRLEKKRLPVREEKGQPRYRGDIEHGIWNKGEKSPPPFLRVDDDVPCRVDRVRALGNAVVPRQAKEAFEILMGL